jgi:hypothetical protein
MQCQDVKRNGASLFFDTGVSCHSVKTETYMLYVLNVSRLTPSHHLYIPFCPQLALELPDDQSKLNAHDAHAAAHRVLTRETEARYSIPNRWRVDY